MRKQLPLRQSRWLALPNELFGQVVSYCDTHDSSSLLYLCHWQSLSSRFNSYFVRISQKKIQNSLSFETLTLFTSNKKISGFISQIQLLDFSPYTARPSRSYQFCHEFDDRSLALIAPHCSGLRSLNLSGTWVKTLALIQSCSSLEDLDISKTAISDCEHIPQSVRRLNGSGCHFLNLSSLPTLPLLESLDLSHIKKNMGPSLPKFPKLRRLVINKSRINSLELLKSQSSLHYLSLGGIAELSKSDQIILENMSSLHVIAGVQRSLSPVFVTSPKGKTHRRRHT